MDNASQAVLKTIAYADIFDFSLTNGEIKQFLIASKRVDSRQIVKTLKSLGKKKIIGKKGDYYCLSGREAIIDERCERGQWTKRKIRLAQKSARLLKIVPWVEAVLLTGGVAKNNACQKDDIDFLVITAPQRLWLSRLVVVLTLGFLRRRRRPKQKDVQDKICLNIFWSADNLSLLPENRSLFAANEISRTRVLWQRKDIYSQLIGANPWIKNYLANAYFLQAARGARRAKKLPRIQTAGRQSSSGVKFWKSFFDFFESLVFKLQLAYMKPKMTRELITSSRAFFHPLDAQKRVLAKYQKRLIRLGLEP